MCIEIKHSLATTIIQSKHSCLGPYLNLLLLVITFISTVLISKKDHLFEIETAQISVVLCSLQMACPFQDKRYAISKIIKVMISLRNVVHLLSKKSLLFCL